MENEEMKIMERIYMSEGTQQRLKLLDSLIDEARNITQPEIWKEDEEQEYLLQCEKFLLKVRNLKKSGE